MKKILLFLNAMIIPLIANTDAPNPHKIIYLVSAPRSLSTAFLRMMDARGDFTVINEPSWYAFDLTIFKPEQVNHLFKEGHPATFKEVKEKIYVAAQKSDVFVKEISFAVASFLLEDDEFIKNPNVHFVLMLRDPHGSLLSFYKKQLMDIPLEKFGYRGCWFIFEKVRKEGANPPVIILAEDLSTNPHETVSIFCQRVGIPFIPESLQWNDLGDNFDGEKNWNDGKAPHELYHWHGDAIHSTGFGALSQYKVNTLGRPTFQEVINEKDRQALLEGYDINMSFYNLLLTQKQYICKNYSVTAEVIKAAAQEWIHNYILLLPAEHAWILANYMYLQYAALSEQILLQQQSCEINLLGNQLNQYVHKNDAQFFSHTVKLSNVLDEFKKNTVHFDTHFKLLQSCIKTIEQFDNKISQDAFDILQNSGMNFIAQIIQQEHETCSRVLGQGYSAAQISLENLVLGNEKLRTIVERKNSPIKQLPTINDLEFCATTVDIMRENMDKLESILQSIQSLSEDVLAINRSVMHIYYNELYTALTQINHCPIPLMINLNGIIPTSDRRDYLHSL